ncbi:hypothetical protein D3C81_1894620 [compost metagenome]
MDIAKGGGCWRNDGSKVWPKWNPLTDDGDALRLAVKLGIETEFFSGTVYAGPRRTAKYSVDASETLDILAATRRAIVRAAAEIGRAMP